MNYAEEEAPPHVVAGWHRDGLRMVLGREEPGEIEPGGLAEKAAALVASYEFADPAILRAVYRTPSDLVGRNMLLVGRFLLLRFAMGVRVTESHDDVRDGEHRIGWSYQTLEGHLEQGKLTWEIAKDLASGDVEFRIRAFSRRAPLRNPVVAFGFRFFGRRTQTRFYDNALQRLADLLETGLPRHLRRSTTASRGRRAADHRSARGSRSGSSTPAGCLAQNNGNLYRDHVTTEVDAAGRQADQREHRLAKLRAAQERGGDAYPYRWPTDATCAGIHAAHPDLAPDVVTDERVSLAGRLALVRRQGGLTFAQLRDRTGAIQLFVDTAVLGAERHHAFDDLDRGDWVGVEGTVMTTRRGELSVRVERFALLGKALREPPDKHRGLTDVETRYRQRYVDLEVNERTRRDLPDPPHRRAGDPRAPRGPRVHRGREARCCSRYRAGRARGPSSPTTTPSTSTSTCASRWSCTSSA